jgi:hypothetical protein
VVYPHSPVHGSLRGNVLAANTRSDWLITLAVLKFHLLDLLELVISLSTILGLLKRSSKVIITSITFDTRIEDFW